MMNSSKVIQYDVFISYRMKDGYEYASTLQRELEQQGFSVYLDDEDLGNGPFHGGVFLTIEKTPVFIAALTSSFFDDIDNDKDWISKELNCAIETGRRICLINPNHEFTGFPEHVPVKVLKALEVITVWDVDFGNNNSVLLNRFIQYLIDKSPSRNNNDSRVFISYSRFDKEIVMGIVNRIQNALGIKCLMDITSIRAVTP